MSGSANRKRATEELRVTPGLVIVEAVYGCLKPSKKRQNGEIVGRGKEKEEEGHDGQDEGLPPPFLDVTIPVQFLVEDGAIKVENESRFGSDTIAPEFVSYRDIGQQGGLVA
jgi:hypothetical protein